MLFMETFSQQNKCVNFYILTVSLDNFMSPDAAETLSITASARPRYPLTHDRGMPLNTPCMPFNISTLPGWGGKGKVSQTSS